MPVSRLIGTAAAACANRDNQGDHAGHHGCRAHQQRTAGQGTRGDQHHHCRENDDRRQQPQERTDHSARTDPVSCWFSS